MTLNEIKALFKESEETGRPIQMEVAQGGPWVNLTGHDTVVFNMSAKCYRVAPPEPPKPREYWIPQFSTLAGIDPVWDEKLARSDTFIRVREIL